MLHKLSPLVKKRKVVGRGGSRGGTSGKGGKGQTQRTGGQSKIRITFEGGQSPLIRRIPKRGFTNVHSVIYQALNVGTLNERFEDGTTITKEMLVEAKILRKGCLVKLLGHGELSKKFVIHSDAASAHAQQMIQEKGGSVILTER